MRFRNFLMGFMWLAGHGAANVTLGIPRLREIVMTASQKPKTPFMTMIIRPGVPQEDVDLFCKRASRVKLSQVVDSVVVREKLKVEGQVRRTQLTVDIKFFSQEEYQAEYDVEPLEILAAFATKFPLTLKKEMLKEMKKLDADLRRQMADLGKGKKSREGADDDEAGEDEEGESTKRKKDTGEGSEVGDGDADDEKRARQQKEQATYDSDEGDMEDPEEYGDADLEAEFASPDENQSVEKKTKGSLKAEVKKVADLFIQNLHQTTSFEFTATGCTFQLEVGRPIRCHRVSPNSLLSQFLSDIPKLLFVGIVEHTCRATIIREIPGITECFQAKEDSKKNGVPKIKVGLHDIRLTNLI